jgi:signal transduction histidine kinase
VKSFRLQLLIGSLLWTLALLAFSHMMFMLVVFHRFPVLNRMITGVAFVAMAGGVAIVSGALAPFRRLRTQLPEIRDGRRRIISGSYPNEVQPLIEDLNSLLEQRERAVRRAQAKAGDLAHGLKTPLAILGQEGQRAMKDGQSQVAEVLLQQVGRMHRQIEYHLAHARAAASENAPGLTCSAVESADPLIRTLQRLYAERQLSFRVEVSEKHLVRVQREDLDEMLGNLLDNACKWAKSQVMLSSCATDGEILIIVDDDGCGISPELRDSVLARGTRLDETTPGSGLGLAIVREIVELYGGSVSLGISSLGGLKVCLQLPRIAMRLH